MRVLHPQENILFPAAAALPLPMTCVPCSCSIHKCVSQCPPGCVKDCKWKQHRRDYHMSRIAFGVILKRAASKDVVLGFRLTCAR
jgi:hypothetical protein